MSALLRMGTLLIVLGLIYSWTSKPQTWRWLERASGTSSVSDSDDLADALAQAGPTAGDKPTGDQKPAASAPASGRETVVATATDLDKAEWEKSAKLFEALSDKTVLAPEEMPAYWRCMKWTRAQTFAEMDHRAARNVARLRLLEQPEKYRGHLLRLRLHIMRILDWDAHENSAGVKHVYEAWGWTEQSNDLYVTVFSELPEGMKLGESLHEEGVFVGYFLKDLGFQAFNRNRVAPLLVGRMHRVESAAPAPLIAAADWNWLWMLAVPFVAIGFSAAWLRLRRSRRVPVPAPADEAEMEEWFRSEGGASDPADPGRLGTF
ncbi:MAG TPA: hypothetical protein VGP63_20665 [Planctomycetaceae bacterium]|jgi:hypothetical protein|nr:hypothetical protein [Planctomycetaceae bacterium]